jgi:3-hydroxyacyl-CoA dehydrogenase
MAPIRAGVVGAGTMGAGIAEVLALAGCDVVLQTRRSHAGEQFVDGLAQRYDRALRRGRMTPAEHTAARARVRATDAYDGFADREIVIEAVAEEAPIKAEVLETLERVCPSDAVLASTTSSFTIGDLAAAAARPERVLGLHFFNPVRFVRLVEVIATPLTAPAHVAQAMMFVKLIGMVPLRIRDGTGFLVNRLLFPATAEGCRVYTEHAATPAEIDAECLRWGMLVGPCAMLDMVGLDVALAIARNCERRLGPSYGPPPILERCVAAGRLGRKSGSGIYAYPRGLPEHDPMLDAIRDEVERVTGVPPHTRFSVERLVVPMVNEAIACLAEGIATEREIDLAMTETIGMPHGPLAYCRRIGRDGYLAVVDALVSELGGRFALRPGLMAELPTDGGLAVA